MNFQATISEALKSEREPDKSQKIELKVPQLDLPKWLENLKHNRESKFKKVPDNQLHLDASDGFFFNYNPEDNIYFESNASFNFITGRKARRRGKSRWDWVPHAQDLDQVTHDSYKTNDLNFRVEKRTKKIHLEKDWGGETGNKIVAGRIKRPEMVRDAVKAALHHHPELKTYTFVPKKMKVSEYVKAGAAALETGGTMTVYFAALGAEMKDILANGLTDKSTPNKKNEIHKIQVHFDKKEATDDAKDMYDANRLYNVTAVAEFTFSDPDLLEESYGDQFKLADGKSVPASDIKMIRTNMKEFFDKSWTPVKTMDKLKASPLVTDWKRGWDHIFVTRSEEEYDHFKNRQERERTTRRGYKRGGETRWTWGDKYGERPNPVGLKLKNGPRILMFTPGTKKLDIDKFLAQRWWERRHLHDEMPWRLRDDESLKDAGYQIYFKKQFPEVLKYLLVDYAFTKEEGWRKPASDMLKALGREVYKTDED